MKGVHGLQSNVRPEVPALSSLSNLPTKKESFNCLELTKGVLQCLASRLDRQNKVTHLNSKFCQNLVSNTVILFLATWQTIPQGCKLFLGFTGSMQMPSHQTITKLNGPAPGLTLEQRLASLICGRGRARGMHSTGLD